MKVEYAYIISESVLMLYFIMLRACDLQFSKYGTEVTEPLKSFKASQSLLLKKTQNATHLAVWGRPWGTTDKCHTF